MAKDLETLEDNNTPAIFTTAFPTNVGKVSAFSPLDEVMEEDVSLINHAMINVGKIYDVANDPVTVLAAVNATLKLIEARRKAMMLDWGVPPKKRADQGSSPIRPYNDEDDDIEDAEEVPN